MSANSDNYDNKENGSNYDNKSSNNENDRPSSSLPESPIIATKYAHRAAILVRSMEKNSLVVTNGERFFKFENITSPDDDFSVKYIFPDDGAHKVITRIDKKNFSTLASFNVSVPNQLLPSILNPFPSSPGTNGNDVGIIASKAMTILLPAVAVVSIIYIIKKAGKPKGQKKKP